MRRHPRLLGAVLLAGLWACRTEGGPAAPEKPCDDLTTVLAIQDESGTPRAEFAAGERVRLDVAFSAPADRPCSITLPSSQIYDFIVLRAGTGEIVWQWSALMDFAAVLTTLDFASGQTRAYADFWDPGGGNLPVGEYEAQGFLATSREREKTYEGNFAPSPHRSARVPFRVAGP